MSPFLQSSPAQPELNFSLAIPVHRLIGQITLTCHCPYLYTLKENSEGKNSALLILGPPAPKHSVFVDLMSEHVSE